MAMTESAVPPRSPSITGLLPNPSDAAGPREDLLSAICELALDLRRWQARLKGFGQ